MFSTVSPFAVAALTVAIALSSSVDAFTPSTTFVRTHKVNKWLFCSFLYTSKIIDHVMLTNNFLIHTHIWVTFCVDRPPCMKQRSSPHRIMT